MTNIIFGKLDKSSKKLLSNFFFLAIGQGITFLFPLLLTPFLIRIIGLDKFGLVMIGQAIMSYFYIFTDYGFNLTATQYASVNRENKEVLNLFFWEVLSTKIFLLILGFISLVFLAYCIPKFNEFKELILCSYSLVIGKVLYQTWFFQGIEEVSKMTILSIISKLILGTLFVLIYNKKINNLYIYINLIYALGDIVVGVISIIFVRYFYLKLPIMNVPLKKIINHLKDDYPIFFANFANNIYINSNIVILGFYATSNLVGSYAVAEKVMIAFKQIASVALQATYPYICKLAVVSSIKLKSFLRKETFLFGVIFSLIGISIISFSDLIINLLLNSYQEDSSTLLNLLSFVPCIVSLNMPAYQMLLIHKKKWESGKIIILGAILNIVLNFVLTPFLLAKGTVISIILTEIFVTTGLHLIIFLKHPKYKFL